MNKYYADLRNENISDSLPSQGLSYTSGRYGFTVRAGNIEAACDAARARAKTEGLSERGWTALISPIDARGRADGTPYDWTWGSRCVIDL